MGEKKSLLNNDACMDRRRTMEGKGMVTTTKIREVLESWALAVSPPFFFCGNNTHTERGKKGGGVTYADAYRGSCRQQSEKKEKKRTNKKGKSLL